MQLLAKWPTDYVLGNCDDPGAFLALDPAWRATLHGEFADLTIQDVRIALLHSHDRRKLKETIASGNFALVCYGHTHIAAIDRQGATTVLNPGAIYRANPASVAVVDLSTLEPTIIPL
jgi:predicted phosphodiesterase